MKRIVLAITLSSILAGCSVFSPGGSDEFGCPGMPKGVVCKTPREVYKITDKEKIKKGKNGVGEMPMYVFATAPQESTLAPVPVLEQATVMRIWIAPWVDKNKDLHWPGLVFTQIQPRQWHFGHEEFDGVEPPVPHKMYDSVSSVPARPESSTGSAEMPRSEDEVLN